MSNSTFVMVENDRVVVEPSRSLLFLDLSEVWVEGGGCCGGSGWEGVWREGWLTFPADVDSGS